MRLGLEQPTRGPGFSPGDLRAPVVVAFAAALLLLTIADGAGAATNLALGRPTAQSSTLDNAVSSRAVDGDTNGVLSQGSITHTQRDAEAWWQIDLGDVHPIGAIDIWNRTDCCGDRLHAFYVLLSNTPFTSTALSSTISQPGVTSYYFVGVVGSPSTRTINRSARYIRIQLAGQDFLSLAEVQIWQADTAPIPTRGTNLALQQPATQSSNPFGAGAERAVDGSTEGDWTFGSVTHTGRDLQAWWEVDLGGLFPIATVDVWNRTDCCGERLRDFYILVSSRPFTSHDLQETRNQADVSSYLVQEQAGTPTRTVINRLGRYVRIQLGARDFLSLAEVEIRSGIAPQPTPTRVPGSEDNVALGKVATQSSSPFGAPAERAVDGNTDGAWAGNSVSHSGLTTQSWWQVDLGSVQPIATIDIWNRTDCCSDRLQFFYLLVSPEPFVSTDLLESLLQPGVSRYLVDEVAGRPTSVRIDRPGRFVRLQHIRRDFLVLSEVQVWRDAASPTPTATRTRTATPSPTDGRINLARGRPATQSSNPLDSPASRATDGDTNGEWPAGSVTHTGRDFQAWWETDLGAIRSIGAIDVWNRTDCCGDRLRAFYVFVSSTPFASVDLGATLAQAGVSAYFMDGIGARPTRVEVQRQGRYVRVQLARSDYLSLAEVQIWEADGAPIGASATPTPAAPAATRTPTLTPPLATATQVRTPTRTTTSTRSATPNRTATPSRTATRTGTAAATFPPTPTPGPANGPIISYFGMVRPDGCQIGCFNGFYCSCRERGTPTPHIEDGIRIYPAQGGQRGLLVVEADPGSNRRQVGRILHVEHPCVDRPSLQIQADADLGNGLPINCAAPTPVACREGVDGVSPPNFASAERITASLNDLACHFEGPITRFDETCTLNGNGVFFFLGGFGGGHVQFCYNVANSTSFPEGDTLLTVRMLDESGTPGPTAQIKIRVPTRTPLP